MSSLPLLMGDLDLPSDSSELRLVQVTDTHSQAVLTVRYWE